MKKKIVAVTMLMTLHLGIASYSAAAERGFYFGGGAGKSTLDADINLSIVVNDLLVPLSSSDLDKTSSAFEGLVGYRFLPYLAVEAWDSYIDSSSPHCVGRRQWGEIRAQRSQTGCVIGAAFASLVTSA